MIPIGLVVNPIAGLGGRVGLKGSDGVDLQRKALDLGAQPLAGERATQALEVLYSMVPDIRLFTFPASMGEDSARKAGISPHILEPVQPGLTSAEDTRRAARQMVQNEVNLILFAGGDGTARDIFQAIGSKVPALGIPAGVKIQSAVYATHPRTAGELAAAFLRGEARVRLGEVMDLDEDAFREGRISGSLYGFLTIPYLHRFVQGVKSPNPVSEAAVMQGIATSLAERLEPGWLHIFGPGSTTQAVSAALGLEKSLLGVDAELDGKMVAIDASEATLLELLSGQLGAEIVVTPIGGQGCVFGRGNQPISPEVLRIVGRKHVHIVSTPEKIHMLRGAPLWVDTGDGDLDGTLTGYYEVLTGFKDSIIYKVTG